MIFVAISDTHCRHRSLKLPKGDVLLHAGDITTRGHRTEASDFIEWFASQPHRHKIFIAGNHDFYLEKNGGDALIKQLPPGVNYLNDSGVSIEGFRIWGSPYTPWFHNWAFNVHRGAPLRRHWQLIPEGTDVLITHGPPFGVLDTVLSGRSNGDRDLLQRVQQIRPQAHVFGHIHEAYGRARKGTTQFFNCSQLNESYELVNKPFVFEVKVPNLTAGANLPVS